MYTYRVCAGNDSFKIPWGEGSFTFEKMESGVLSLGSGKENNRLGAPASLMAGKNEPNLSDNLVNELTRPPARSSLVVGKGDACVALTEEVSGWILQGDFFEEGAIPAPDAYYEFQQPKWQPIQMEAHPNPFNPEITIFFKLPVAGFINLSVYNVAGKKVAELANGYRLAGEQDLIFDGSGLPSGVYFIRLSTEKQSVVKKVLLVK